MSDDLIGTKAVATLLGVSVATVNRWGADDNHELRPAVTIPGPERAAARLYRRQDVEAFRHRRVARAIEKGACPRCTTVSVVAWHGTATCPVEASA